MTLSSQRVLMSSYEPCNNGMQQTLSPIERTFLARTHIVLYMANLAAAAAATSTYYTVLLLRTIARDLLVRTMYYCHLYVLPATIYDCYYDH